MKPFSNNVPMRDLKPMTLAAPPLEVAGGYEFDGFVLDARRRSVHRHGTPVRLTARHFNTLLLFVEHPGELLGKDWLMEALWPGLEVGENSLSQVVCNLRRILSGSARGYIQTESGYGFRFVCPVKRLSLADAAGTGPPAAVLDTLSLIMAMQVVITRHLAEALAPHVSDAAQRGLALPTSGGSSGHAPSRTPAFPL